MDDWHWHYDHYDPAQERLREALCTLGNGYFATRGAAPESTASEDHYPGTYLAGGYDRARSEVQGRMVENEDLVNLPNWLPLRLRLDDGSLVSPDDMAVLEYHQSLAMHDGVLSRELTVRDASGRRTRLRERRLVHMQHQHLAALETEITALDWSGAASLESALDGSVRNTGVERYRGLEDRHLETLETRALGEDAMVLRVRTLQSRLEIALAARTRLRRGGAEDAHWLDAEPSVSTERERITQTFQLDLEAGQPVVVEKVVALYTGRDAAISACGLEAHNAVAAAPDFATLLAAQARTWQHLWQRFDLELDLNGKDSAADAGRTASILRLHLFHLLVTAAPTVMDLDVGVPARGLHGEAYRGHIFWDELFIFPTLNLRLPEITRSLLMYRWRRLPAARAAAQQAGYRGAMYPWQSGSNGREESQELHLNPRSGHWTPDETHLQRHVSSAIAYNLWQYYETTGDTEFLAFYGAEMLLEIARFWATKAQLNQALERYEIKGVVGPDEFHTRYPDRAEPGLDNHAYTTVMASWVLCRALELPQHLPRERWEELVERLGIDDDELTHWDSVSRKLRICFHGDGIISQFEGFERLPELDWVGYRERHGDIQRLDRILEAEGDSPNRYQATKQADVLMLFYLFSTEELSQVFDRLGYDFDPDMIPRNVAYYGTRTSHGSTLSRVVDAWVLARSDRPRSWRLFTEAVASDVADIQGGTTSEGIHLGAMAGTVDLIQRCYAGIAVHGGRLWLNPSLPDELQCLRIRLRFRGRALAVDIDHARVALRVIWTGPEGVRLTVGEETIQLETGDTHEVPVSQAPFYLDARRPVAA